MFLIVQELVFMIQKMFLHYLSYVIYCAIKKPHNTKFTISNVLYFSDSKKNKTHGSMTNSERGGGAKGMRV